VGKLPSAVFTGIGEHDGTLDPAELDRLTTKKPHWATHDAVGLKSAALMWRLNEVTQGDFHRAAGAFLSLLATPGTLVSKADGKAMMVLAATAHGMVTYRLPLAKDVLLRFGPAADKRIEYQAVLEHEAWRVCEVDMLLPRSAGNATNAIGMKFAGKGSSLLTHAARRGGGFCNRQDVALSHV
jgi:hypothetical protein